MHYGPIWMQGFMPANRGTLAALWRMLGMRPIPGLIDQRNVLAGSWLGLGNALQTIDGATNR